VIQGGAKSVKKKLLVAEIKDSLEKRYFGGAGHRRTSIIDITTAKEDERPPGLGKV